MANDSKFQNAQRFAMSIQRRKKLAMRGGAPPATSNAYSQSLIDPRTGRALAPGKPLSPPINPTHPPLPGSDVGAIMGAAGRGPAPIPGQMPDGFDSAGLHDQVRGGVYGSGPQPGSGWGSGMSYLGPGPSIGEFDQMLIGRGGNGGAPSNGQGTPDRRYQEPTYLGQGGMTKAELDQKLFGSGAISRRPGPSPVGVIKLTEEPLQKPQSPTTNRRVKKHGRE